MPYPVSVSVDPHLTGRNRLTTAFRLILAIPHGILVGGPGASFVLGSGPGDESWRFGGETGLLGAVAYFLAIVNWFAIVFTGRPIEPIRDLALFYLRWRTRAVGYMALFVDEYPPFGDAAYPARVEVTTPATRDRLTVAFRLILAIPHFIVLAFVLFGWLITSVIAWVGILLTGNYPAAVYGFGVGAMRWMLRVEAYMLLLVDEYPPFSLD